MLDAAHEVLAAQGPTALTMRAVARRLQVAPNALYSHVDSKTALLDDLLDDLLADVTAPDPAAPDPSAAVTQMMESTYDVLTAHPELVPLFLSRQGARGPNAVRSRVRCMSATLLLISACCHSVATATQWH